MAIPKPVILDISEWQPPASINYDKLCAEIDAAIVRVQYGSRYIDKHYKTHIREFQKRKVPVAVYAWIRGVNNADMEKEATDFYNRAKEFNPTYWWLDVEEQSMADMRGGTEAYRKKLKALGANKVGVYVANHLYKQFNLDTSKFDAVWVPTYGANNGQYSGSNPTATSNYHLHQYTSEGKLNGYSGSLDLSRVAKGQLSDYFGEDTPQTTVPANKLKEGNVMLLFVENGKVYWLVGNQYVYISSPAELAKIKELMAKAGYDTWEHTNSSQIKYIKKIATLAK